MTKLLTWEIVQPQAVKLRAEGKTYAEIAVLLNCDERHVSTACAYVPKGETEKQRTARAKKLEAYEKRQSAKIAVTVEKFRQKGMTDAQIAVALGLQLSQLRVSSKLY